MTAKNNHPELIAQLTEGIANLTSSEDWQHYLDFQSRFHRYSFGNVLLIAAQCHEATRVAGFNAWRKMNRFVRKGEKAIWILAPMVYKNADAEDGESDRVIRGFKFVAVFDVAQTDGEELPSICNRIDGDDPAGLYAQLVTVAQSIGFSVEDHEFGGSTNGDCTYDLHRIRVETHNTPAQRVKTLAHEIAHALLHESLRRPGAGRARGRVHGVRRLPGAWDRLERLLLRVRRNLGRWRRRGHRRDQGVLRAHPEERSDHPAGLRARSRGAGAAA